MENGFATPTFLGAVTRVVGGDTFYMTGQDVRIRVLGLGAPEVGTYGGSAATATMSRLVAGEQMTCSKRDTDKHGRTVGQCVLADGHDIAAAMTALAHFFRGDTFLRGDREPANDSATDWAA